jgi:diguanylate cyclase (GGDEF)-like protein
MKDNNFPRAKIGHDIGVRSAIGFPIVCDKAVVAVFEFFSFHVKYCDDELLKTFQMMSEQMSRVFERKNMEKKLNFIAYHDSLTGIGNRVHFERVAEEAMSRTARHGKKMAIFLLDLDGFKQVNDSFGHGVGDSLLQEVVHRLRNVVRATDALARIGGDEFVAIAEEIVEPKAVEIIANKILTAVSQPFYIKEYVINITISIGIALYLGDGDTLPSVMRNADLALYKAKETGKNKFCVSCLLNTQ